MTQLMTTERVHRALAELNRDRDLLGSGFKIDTGWWRTELTKAGWELRGKFAEPGVVAIGRQDLFALAPSAEASDEEVISFVFHVLFWGSGDSRRHNKKRIAAVLAPEGRRRLRCWLELPVDDLEGQFKTFRNCGNLISHLGPAFFSKLMYFAAGGAPEHKALIIDNRVLRTLSKTAVGQHLPVIHDYGVDTYLAACGVLEELAVSARNSADPRLAGATADLVEFWAFGLAGAVGAPTGVW